MESLTQPTQYLKKSLAGFLIIVFGIGLLPQTSYAIWGAGDIVSDPPNTAINTKDTIESSSQTGLAIKDFIKDFVLDPLAYTVASQIAEKLTQRIVNWSNSGFDGNPFYVEDYGEYFKDLALEERDAYFQHLSGGNNPFASTLISTIDATRSGESVADQFTLDTVFGDNWEDFNQDFSQGGWDRWIAGYTPANNPWGSYLQASNELNKRINTNESRVQLDLQSNNGFLSFRECIDPPLWKPGDQIQLPAQLEPWQEAANKAEPNPSLHYVPVGKFISVPCNQWETQTPGTAIESRVNQALNEPLARLRNANKYGEIVAASLNAMVGSLVSGGLKKLSDGVDLGIDKIIGGVSTPEEAAELTAWANSPNQIIDLDLELNGDILTFAIDEDTGASIPLAEPVVVPGAIALLEEEITILRDQLNNPVYGLRGLPYRLMDLDHELPGPDRGWIGRLQDALESNKDYKKVQKKANKDKDKAEDHLTNIQIVLANEIPEVQIKMLDPNNSIPGAIVYQDKINQVDDYDGEINTLTSILTRKSQTLALLKIMQDRIADPNITEDEENRLAFQYTRLQEVTTPEVLEDQKSKQQQQQLLAEELAQDIIDVRAAVQTKKQQEPSWNELNLFCKPLSDGIYAVDDFRDNSRRQVRINCSDYYNSEIIDYIQLQGL